ncbi:hypothetical protein ACMFMG_007251 [Clarireedia jacksonii]
MARQSFQHSHATGPVWAARAPRPLLKDDEARWDVENVPNAPAHISTHRGRFPKRPPTINPITIVRHDFKVDMKRKAAKLRKEFPEIIRFVKKPTAWDDLYHLWDAADIQTESPKFLYYVLHYIGTENEQLDKESDDQKAKEIDSFAGEWVAENRSSLLDVESGNLYNILCADEDISGLTPAERSMLQTSLHKHHSMLIRNTTSPSTLPCQQIEPMHNVPQSSYGPSSSASATHTRASSDHGQHAKPASDRRAMPLPAQSQSMSNLKPEQSAVSDAAQSGLQAFDKLMESEPTTISSQAPPADGSGELTHKNSNIDAPVSQPGNRVSPVENSSNRRTSWTRQYGQTQPIRSGSQDHKHEPTALSSSIVRDSPPRNLQQEPIYVHNTHRGVAPKVGDEHNNTTRITDSTDTRGTHESTHTQAVVLHDTLDFGPMEGDPHLRKSREHCVYEYGNGQPGIKAPYGRTLFVSGPSWESFVTHQVKDLFSECGPVESIRYLLKGKNTHGPIFITFETDVLEAAINRFDGYTMSDGYRILAKYPRNDTRDRSSSQSSFGSYNGGDASNLTPKPGFVSRSQSRRPSVSFQRSRSSSGAGGHRYLNERQLPPMNDYRHLHHEFCSSSNMNSLHYKPGQYSPQVLSGEPFRSMVSEVVQHEMGMYHFQQQMPIVLRNSRPNTVNKIRRDELCSPGNLTPQKCSNSPGSGISTPRAPNNFKENSPLKRSGALPASPGKDINNVQTSKHIRPGSSKNTSVPSAPLASLVESSPKAEVGIAIREKPLADSPSTTGTLKLATIQPDDNVACSNNFMDLEVEKRLETSNSGDAQSLVACTDHQRHTQVDHRDTKGSESATSPGQSRNKNTEKPKKNKKFANKMETSRETSPSPTPTTLSPTDTECTTLTSAGKAISTEQAPHPKLSVSFLSQSENCFSEINRDVVTRPAALKKNEVSSANAAETKFNLRVVSDNKSLTSPTETIVKVEHKRAKIGSSSGKGSSGPLKDDKTQKSQSSLAVTSISSSAIGSFRKVDAKLALSKNDSNGTVQTPKKLDQKSRRTDSRSALLSPGDIQETALPTPGNLASSTDWPLLAPSRSPQSVIADGKPPQVPSIPPLNFRKVTEAIAPALPLTMPCASHKKTK